MTKLNIYHPQLHSPGIYYVPNRFMFDTINHKMLFSIGNHHVEYNYNTHQVTDFLVNEHFEMYTHPDFESCTCQENTKEFDSKNGASS